VSSSGIDSENARLPWSIKRAPPNIPRTRCRTFTVASGVEY
jgi:hypothetical protein